MNLSLLSLINARSGSSLLTVISLVLLSGCQSNRMAGDTAQNQAAPPSMSEADPAAALASSSADPASAASDATAAAVASVPLIATTPAKTQEEALAGVLDQLQQIGAIDPKAQQMVMADLRDAKPGQYALIVNQFQTALAYRQQSAEREAKAAQEHSVAEVQQVQPKNAPEKPAAETKLAVTPASTALSSEKVAQQEAEPLLPARYPVEVAVSPTGTEEPSQSVATTQLLPQPPLPIDPTETEPVPTVEADQQVQQVSYPAATSQDWQDHLDSAIAEVEQSVSQQPDSTEEMHQHMRLRLLYLLAGREQDALLPVPGAEPAEQDYWAKQLFAMSTYLDVTKLPNTKQRATAALVHLDEARNKLGELGMLQVRRLTIVNSVDGYGTYEPRKETVFRLGEQLMLYAEVGSYRSESTPEGWRSSLSTSYEVVDDQGRRVDGGQFPDVEDYCQNFRRDFHVQYGISLPSRIYPGPYELRLTVTDNLSNKRSQTSVPFEIVE